MHIYNRVLVCPVSIWLTERLAHLNESQVTTWTVPPGGRWEKGKVAKCWAKSERRGGNMPLFSGASVLNSSILRDRGGRGQMRGRMHKSKCGEHSSTCSSGSTGSHKGPVDYDPPPFKTVFKSTDQSLSFSAFSLINPLFFNLKRPQSSSSAFRRTATRGRGWLNLAAIVIIGWGETFEGLIQKWQFGSAFTTAWGVT